VKRTYRLETLRLVDDLKVTQFAIDAALAQPTDRLLTVWEDMFLPGRLRDALLQVRVAGPENALVPVVADERVIYKSRSHEERSDFPTLWLPYLIVGLLIAIELLGVGLAAERSPLLEKIFRAEAALWACATGLLGTILLLGWLITEHVFWYRNENLLLVGPLSLWLAGLLIASIRRPHLMRPAAICAVIVAMLSAVALIVKGIPGFTQNNVPLILFFLPPHFALAFGLWRRARRLTSAERSPSPAS
jgi:hypothetical protein